MEGEICGRVELDQAILLSVQFLPGLRTWSALANGVLLILSLALFQSVGIAQNEDLQRKSAEAFRQAVQEIKQCKPEKEFGDDPDHSGIMYIGSPLNITWDISPNKSVRAPLAGYIEFSTPRKFVLSAVGASHFKPDYEGIMMQAAWTQRHRYEFDVSSSGIDLVKTLRLGKTEWIDEEPNKYCWQEVARKIEKMSPE